MRRALTLRISFLASLLLLSPLSPGSTYGHASEVGSPPKSDWAEIRVVDAETGQGVPLVELRTVNEQLFVTDNCGRVAFQEPGLMGEEVFFFVHSHGYEAPRDGFGMEGVRVIPRPGEPVEIRLRRTQLARRVCRLTGEGRFRDTLLLGYERPLPESEHPGKVAGQDSIQPVIYQDRIYHFWGDTQRMSYPLGLFRMAGATTPLPEPGEDISVEHGLPYDYFTDEKTGFARAMMPLPERPEGVVWVESVFVVPDASGRERMVGHYSRRKNLSTELEQGIAVFNDEQQIFEPAIQLPLTATWRKPTGHPIVIEEEGIRWLVFGSPCPNVRVPARYEDVLNPGRYEAFTCVSSKDAGSASEITPRQWRWQKELPPVDSARELEWAEAGTIKPDDTRFLPQNIDDPSELVRLHRGTVHWNEFRQKWILIAGQLNGTTSHLGEIWYSESDHPTGPFRYAKKIVTHDRQTFYNVCHHPFLDRDGGATIYFEGTYTSDFSGNSHKTPRYNYNQILYELDLTNPLLHSVAASVESRLPWIEPSADKTHFVEAGTDRPFFVWGVNYDHDGPGRLIEDYWIDEWETVEEDFAEIADLGANVVRIHLQVGRFMNSPDEPNQENLDQLRKLLELAERNRLYLDLTGLGCYHKQDIPAWYTEMGEADRWNVQARFWTAIASVCKDSPAVFCYDLMNEPVVSGKPEDGWHAGELGGKHFVQRLTLTPGDRTAQEIAKAWVKKLTDAIREVDDRHMITVGVIPWAHVFKNAKPLFYSPEVSGPLDFVSVHFYPKAGEVEAALAALKVYEIGKPLIVEEIFPLKSSLEEVKTFIDESRSFCDGYVSFYWGKTIEENRAEGDMKGAILASWLEQFREHGREIRNEKKPQ